MSYESVIKNLVSKDKHKTRDREGWDKSKKYAYYVGCHDGFFNDTQIIICKTLADAEYVAEKLKIYNKIHKGAYTRIRIGQTETMRIPTGEFALLVDSKYTWWRT